MVARCCAIAVYAIREREISWRMLRCSTGYMSRISTSMAILTTSLHSRSTLNRHVGMVFSSWDHLQLYRHSDIPVVDAWVALAAVAARTERIRLGPVITPVARRRPWKLAREVVSLDQLSRGRVIFGVGLGTPPDAEFRMLRRRPL